MISSDNIHDFNFLSQIQLHTNIWLCVGLYIFFRGLDIKERKRFLNPKGLAQVGRALVFMVVLCLNPLGFKQFFGVSLPTKPEYYPIRVERVFFTGSRFT
jgi:hypothetical protein